MHTKQFGNTGVDLSILGFGCMRLPQSDPAAYEKIDVPLATAMVHKAIDHGVNYFDTAYPYHRSGGFSSAGTSEPFLAGALKGGYREKAHVATKLPTWFMDSADQMRDILDQQLRRLETDRIEFYLAHNLNRGVWPKIRDVGMFDFLDRAKREGKIRWAGFSYHDNYALYEEIIEAYPWDFVQIQYNYLDKDHQAGEKGLKLAKAKGMGVVIMEPLRGGFLINNMPDDIRAGLTAARPDWSLADWGLRWLWNQPEVDVVLSGMSTMDQLDENLAIAEGAAPLAPEESDAVDRAREDFLSRIKVPCTACGYCLPCPAGVGIPPVLNLYNEYYLVDTPENRNRAIAMYNMQAGTMFGIPDKCVGCRECEPRCPQGIEISHFMPEAVKTLKK